MAIVTNSAVDCCEISKTLHSLQGIYGQHGKKLLSFYDQMVYSALIA